MKWTGIDGTSLDSEMRWKNFGETTTEEGYQVFFNGKRINTSVALEFLFTRTS